MKICSRPEPEVTPEIPFTKDSVALVVYQCLQYELGADRATVIRMALHTLRLTDKIHEFSMNRLPGRRGFEINLQMKYNEPFTTFTIFY